MHLWLGHVVPEALLGGPIALVEDGDKVIIDTEKRSIDWVVDAEEESRRRKLWEATGKGELKVKRGVLKRYARDVQVSSASGKLFWGFCVTVSFVAGERWSVL
jgi:dihydroxy-acid dehydratase